MSVRKEIKEEADLITHSGELPEVAFYESLYFLTESPQGPKLKLSKQEKQFLKRAVIKGYVRIICRDLNPQNRKRPFFRGIERAIWNLKRLKRFAEKEDLSFKRFKRLFKKGLKAYTEVELKDIALKKLNCRTINCSYEQWEWLCEELSISNPLPASFFERKPLTFKETIKLFRH